MSSKEAKGKRAKTRSKLKRKGPKLTVNALLKKPAINSRAIICIDSSVHAGLPAPKFHGMAGTVKAIKKNCVEVWIDGCNKKIAVHPAHLKVFGGESK
ncbi:MAG: hypothetical protein QXK06_01725 [Candidatus Diapherotrites archaeon]